MKNYSFKETTNPNLDRVVDLDGDWKVYYSKKEKKFKRGITSILNRTYPKGAQFYQAMKNATPEEWDKKMNQAMDRGDAIHQFIRIMLMGDIPGLPRVNRLTQVMAEDNITQRSLTNDEWTSVLAFQSFWTAHDCSIIANEDSVEGLDYAGTLDQIIRIRKKCDNRYCECEKFVGKIGISDVKTGAGVYDSYGAQLGALANADLSHLILDNEIDFTLVIHLNRKTKVGWATQFYDKEETQKHFMEFQFAKGLDDVNYKPFNADKDIYEIPEEITMQVKMEKLQPRVKMATMDQINGK
jgi:hypothetical protein